MGIGPFRSEHRIKLEDEGGEALILLNRRNERNKTFSL
jgi:hypothetical protein